ncbi:MAG: hypothetical protein ACE5FS_03345 [Paracoccaceae bacterium]
MQNKTVASGGIGGAVGFIVVLVLGQTTDWALTPEQASGLTGALAVVFGYLARFLPQPPR